jgi:hypothetical protein
LLFAHRRHDDLRQMVGLFGEIELTAIRKKEVAHFLRRDGDLGSDLMVDHFLAEQLATQPIAHVGDGDAALGQLLLKRVVRNVALGIFERLVQLAVGDRDFQRACLGDEDVLKDEIVEQAQLRGEDFLLSQPLRGVARTLIGLVDVGASDFAPIDDGPRVG